MWRNEVVINGEKNIVSWWFVIRGTVVLRRRWVWYSNLFGLLVSGPYKMCTFFLFSIVSTSVLTQNFAIEKNLILHEWLLLEPRAAYNTNKKYFQLLLSSSFFFFSFKEEEGSVTFWICIIAVPLGPARIVHLWTYWKKQAKPLLFFKTLSPFL